MQFSLPTTPTDLLPVPAPVASGADAALLTPTGDGAAPAEFSAVLDGQTAAPTLLPFAVAANPLPAAPALSPDAPPALVVQSITPPPVAATVAANVLTAPMPNPLVAPRVPSTALNPDGDDAVTPEGPTAAGVRAETASGVGREPTAEEPDSSRPMAPRQAVRVPRGVTRREEEQAAALSLTASVQPLAPQPAAVLTFDVSPTGEIAPTATPTAEAAMQRSNAAFVATAANVAEASSPQTQTMRAAQAFWAKNNSSAAVTVAPVAVATDANAITADDAASQTLPFGPSARIAFPPVDVRQADNPFATVRTDEATALVVPAAAPSARGPQVAPAPVSPVVSTGTQMPLQAEAAPLMPVAATAQPVSPVLAPAEIERAVASTQAGADVPVRSGTPAAKAAREARRAGAENFSTSAAGTESTVASGSATTALKKILSAAPQSDSEESAGLGIGLADGRGKMRNDSQPPFAAVQQVEEISVASSAVAGLREALATLAPSPEVSPSAAPRVQSVVNYLVEAAQRLDTHTVSSMDLRFNFGADDQLSVRVELRDGAVHTTFRTDSSVLRETIGNAWRELAPANTMAEGRTVRLADPTIIRESANAEFSANAGSGDSRSSQQQQQQQAAEFAQTSFALAAGRNRVVRRVAALVEPVVAPLSLRPATARHLHAVA